MTIVSNLDPIPYSVPDIRNRFYKKFQVFVGNICAAVNVGELISECPFHRSDAVVEQTFSKCSCIDYGHLHVFIISVLTGGVVGTDTVTACAA